MSQLSSYGSTNGMHKSTTLRFIFHFTNGALQEILFMKYFPNDMFIAAQVQF